MHLPFFLEIQLSALPLLDQKGFVVISIVTVSFFLAWSLASALHRNSTCLGEKRTALDHIGLGIGITLEDTSCCVCPSLFRLNFWLGSNSHVCLLEQRHSPTWSRAFWLSFLFFIALNLHWNNLSPRIIRITTRVLWRRRSWRFWLRSHLAILSPTQIAWGIHGRIPLGNVFSSTPVRICPLVFRFEMVRLQRRKYIIHDPLLSRVNAIILMLKRHLRVLICKTFGFSFLRWSCFIAISSNWSSLRPFSGWWFALSRVINALGHQLVLFCSVRFLIRLTWPTLLWPLVEVGSLLIRRVVTTFVFFLHWIIMN